jgi:hypothetical protein
LLGLLLACAQAGAQPVQTAQPSPQVSLQPSPQPMMLIHVSGKRVQFFYDRFLLEAYGNVRVTTGDGMTMSGDTFSMDLKLNRFLLAGHVHMQNPSGSQDGAAIADFLDFNRIYLVPFVRESQQTTGIPDRWTFLDGDFAHPAKGREMPGDTFFFPDLGNAKAFVTAGSAVVGTKSFVRMSGGAFDIGAGAGIYMPVPSFYVNFSTDPHMGENSLAGANYDATWNFAGGAHSISALHFRYDTANKTYLSFEQHFSGPKAYAVFSVNPMTRPSKFWDLLTSYQPSDNTQIRTFTQLHTFQIGLSNPLESGQVTTVQVNQGLRRAFVQASYQFQNFSLLPPNPGAPFEHGPVINNPSNGQLSIQTFDERIGKLPIFEHVTLGMGYQHNASNAAALFSFGGQTYTTLWQHTLGLTLFSPQVKIGGSDLTIKNYYVNLSFSKSRQWNSIPHQIDGEDTVISLSKLLDTHWSSYLHYEVQNTADLYGSLQSTIYPGFTPVVNGVSYPGYQAFHGIATFRTLSFGLNYANAGNFTFNLLARKHNDFPAPIPFFFTFSQPNLLGQYSVQNYLGQAPYDVTGEVRVRINPHMSLDIQRSYFFNYSGLRWSPSFYFQVMQ